MQFHHVGFPNTTERQGEIRLEAMKMSITDAGANPYHVEWLRFDNDSPMPAAIQSEPHVAFFVDDLKAAVAGKTMVMEPWEAMPGLWVAFVREDGALLEFMQKTA